MITTNRQEKAPIPSAMGAEEKLSVRDVIQPSFSLTLISGPGLSGHAMRIVPMP